MKDSEDRLRSLYIDIPSWQTGVEIDDFLVAIGKKQSNSVYHIAQVKATPRKNLRMIRYHLKVFKSDLITALQRDPDQIIMPIYWYSRNKK